MNALTTTWKRPRVRMYSGIDKNCTTGLMIALTKPKITATTKMMPTLCNVVSPPTKRSPCTNWVTTHNAKPVNAARSRKGPMPAILPSDVPGSHGSHEVLVVGAELNAGRAESVGAGLWLAFSLVQTVEALCVQPADLGARILADIRAGAQMLGAFGPFAVPVRVVAGEHDEVGAEHVDHTGQDRLLGLAGHPDVARGQVVVRIAAPAALDPVAALLVMLMQAIDEKRDPARARLEEGNPQLWMPFENAAGDKRGHRRHLVERKTDAVHLDVVREAVDADFRQMNAGGPVDAEWHPELHRSGVERVQIGVVEVAGLECRRYQSRHQPEVLGFGHDVDGYLPVFDRG